MFLPLTPCVYRHILICMKRGYLNRAPLFFSACSVQALYQLSNILSLASCFQIIREHGLWKCIAEIRRLKAHLCICWFFYPQQCSLLSLSQLGTNRQQSKHICSDYVNKWLSEKAFLLGALPVPVTPVLHTPVALAASFRFNWLLSKSLNHGSSVLIRMLDVGTSFSNYKCEVAAPELCVSKDWQVYL